MLRGFSLCAFVVLLLCPLYMRAADKSQPIFPSDTQKPTQQDVLELQRAVCAGGSTKGNNISCGPACPEFTDVGKFGDEFDWTVVGVNRGHFLSANSEDAAFAVGGCEPHSANFGGTILLTERDQGWSMLWYKAGVDTTQCHKVPLGRDILVCLGSSGGQGTIATGLYIEDLLDPKPVLMAGDGDAAFLSVFDSTSSCGWNQDDQQNPFPLIRAWIEKIEFVPQTESVVPTIRVTAEYGRMEMTPQKSLDCTNRKGGFPEEMLPRMKEYRMEFTFDGTQFQPTPASFDAARVFTAR